MAKIQKKSIKPPKIQKKDTQVFIPGYGHPFPDPSIPMPKSMHTKLYRKNPRFQEYDNGTGDIEIVYKPRAVRPVKMPKLVEKDVMQRRILKNPRKYSTLS